MNSRNTTLERACLDLRNSLGASTLVVKRPDHPYLFSAPDILVAGEGRLAAFFLPSSRDNKNYDDLRARLIAARIALPNGTTTVLVLPPDRPSPPQDIVRALTETVAESEVGRRRSVLRMATQTVARPLDADVRTQAFERFSVLQFASQRLGADSAGHNLAGSKQANLKLRAEVAARLPVGDVAAWPSGIKPPKDVIYQGRCAVAVKHSSKKEGLLSRVRSLCVYSLCTEYVLDNGGIYQRDIMPNLVVANSHLDSRTDPDKAIRALAFAGWVTVESQSPEFVADAWKWLQKEAKKRGLA